MDEHESKGQAVGLDLSRATGVFAEWLQQSRAESERSFERLVALHPEIAAELRELERRRAASRAGLRVLTGSSPSGAGAEPSPSLRLDEFECRRRIGRGGMGEVWEAYDHALKRTVALKLLAHGTLADERQVARFAREAEAAARVRHENVVAIFKAGSDQGMHYIAEELVVGGRTLLDEIETWRRRGELPDPRHLAQLFVRVARALGAAHESGVVHRDVKPSNVLIAPDGSPKVADFGVARLVDDLSLSQTGDFVGTYSYASPEQVRPDGRGVDAQSDVFSLGATLYECLAWRRPFEGESAQAVIDAIAREDPPDPRSVRGSVPADLALIALKALEKRRENRYRSMRELEQDLERYRTNVPILARAPSRLRRLQKWTLRHPTASATIALSALAFVALAALTWRAEHLRGVAERAELAQRETSESLARTNDDLRRSQAEAARQAQSASTEAALSKEVEAFLTGLFESADPALYGREEPTLREVVERGRASLLAGEVENPEVRARLATTLAAILSTLGAFSESSELLDDAAATWQELGREEDPAAQDTRFSQAVEAFNAGQDPAALAILDELEARRSEGRLDPELAWPLARMRATVLARQGNFAEAEAAFEEAEELGRAGLEEGSNELVILRTRRGEMLYRWGRLAEIEEILAPDTPILEPLLDSGNTLALDHFTLLALTWLGEKRLEEAERLLERIVKASEENLGEDHARSINSRNNLATVLEQQGELERAEALYLEAWETSEARYGRTSSEACTARNNLANCLARQGRFDEAEPIVRDLLADMVATQGEHHLLTTRTRESLAYCLINLGQPEEAAALLERALVDLPQDAVERPALEDALAKLRDELSGGDR